MAFGYPKGFSDIRKAFRIFHDASPNIEQVCDPSHHALLIPSDAVFCAHIKN